MPLGDPLGALNKGGGPPKFGPLGPGVGEGGLPYETEADAHQKFGIRPLKEINLGMELFVKLFVTSKRNQNAENIIYFSLFLHVQPKQDLYSLKYWSFAQNTLSETIHPKFTP